MPDTLVPPGGKMFLQKSFFNIVNSTMVLNKRRPDYKSLKRLLVLCFLFATPQIFEIKINEENLTTIKHPVFPIEGNRSDTKLGLLLKENPTIIRSAVF